MYSSIDSISNSQSCPALPPLRVEYSSSRLMWAADNPNRALACAVVKYPSIMTVLYTLPSGMNEPRAGMCAGAVNSPVPRIRVGSVDGGEH